MPELPKGAGKDSFSLADAGRLFAAMGLAGAGKFLDLACGPGSDSLEAARLEPAELGALLERGGFRGLRTLEFSGPAYLSLFA